ncbi:MAG: SufE family protein [Pseudomonadales bacterium]
MTVCCSPVGNIADLNARSKLPSIAEIEETFGFFDDWEDRYRYVIDLGKDLAPLLPGDRNDASLVKGCQSQVWLQTAYDPNEDRFYLAIDSDAHIVRGLAAILIAALSGRSPNEIKQTDPEALFEALDLLGHLSPSRGNGLKAMIAKIQQLAAAASGDVCE